MSDVQVSITITEGRQAGEVHELLKERTVVGRKNADILISDPKVSSQHLEILIQEGRVYLKDLHSRNGTTVNGVVVSKVELQNLDEIEVGLSKFKITIVEDLKSFQKRNQPEGESEKTGNRDIRGLIDSELKRFSKWDLRGGEKSSGKSKSILNQVTLEIIEGNEKGRVIPLEEEKNTLGRGKATISIRDLDISRVHSVLERRPDGRWSIRDLQSTNGTFVNAKKIEAALLSDGDQIQIGGTIFIFHMKS